MVRPPCCPKHGHLSSANSARAQEMQLLMPMSQVQAQGVQVAQQSPDLRMSVDQKTDHVDYTHMARHYSYTQAQQDSTQQV